MTTGFRSLFCHPEPGPELDSGSIDFGISVFGFKNLGFKAPPLWGSLLLRLFFYDAFLPFQQAPFYPTFCLTLQETV